MAYKDLRDFIDLLDKKGLLKRIAVEVDTDLEITEITDRVSKDRGPALYFIRPKGYDMPILTNAFGTEERIKMALDVDSLNDLSDLLESFLSFDLPVGLIDKLKILPRLKDIAGYLPKIVKDGPCKEVIIIDNPSLDIFPILKCWPKDGGKYITLPMVFTRSLEGGKRNCGMYRMQVYDNTTTGMHWHIHKHGAMHYKEYERMKKRMEIAVAIGSDPAVVISSTIPLPPDFDEMIFAGFLRGEGVKMVKCETVNIEVPANSEIVLEGYVDPFERRVEGPFGDHTGFYSLRDEYPVFHITCITHRKNPIYHATVVGMPPMEDCYIGYAIERLMLPLLKRQFPEVVDIHMPFEGVFHNLIIVSIKKSYPGHARKIMHALWGLGQAMFSKVIVIVDEDVDVHDTRLVTWKVLNNIDPERDIEFVLGPIETLDHASRLPQYGSKMGVDGTRKWKEEGFTRGWPEESIMDKSIVDMVNKRWREYGFKLSP
ncbi:MAG: menaquinone biosynthesis decarboxylase [Nitrospinae bacterium]|nr:menaquinone biosynthesis decarboxylase [Nitrospinota bacterium]